MEEISFPLVLIAATAMGAALMFLPRAPKALHLFLALLVIALALSGLFWPIRAPISHEFLVALRLGAASLAIAWGAAVLIRVASRRIADGSARGS